MYAPKLQSWKTPFDRASEVIAFKVDTMADEATAEIGVMFADLRKEFPPGETKIEEPWWVAMQGLAANLGLPPISDAFRQQQAMMGSTQEHDYLRGMAQMGPNMGPHEAFGLAAVGPPYGLSDPFRP